MSSSSIDTIVFDLGGVLVDWNPRYLYSQIFSEEKEMLHFLENVCTSDWNEEQDAGRSLAEATRFLVEKHPDYKDQIQAYYGRWEEMLKGAIPGTVEILRALKDSGQYRLYALTNWSVETFPIALNRFDFLKWFEGIVVSGEEKTRKPFPPIFEILQKRYNVIPENSIFIDDNLRNIEGAKACNYNAIPFTSPEQLRRDLEFFGVRGLSLST